ncbi:hypothetical protein PV08_05897 [Exophiala spinifera]|uniref:Uncharacterized protein n=1 Tax=Exophiala spinifera TaxID=91928 RepID=A0A0D1ZSP6_9EURO|nr:uncharacterized protein PV08_05897 [Exophiala spinifera]KIW15847.1 hypothetical protein PV08_05897 [Exophiala spinifera]
MASRCVEDVQSQDHDSTESTASAEDNPAESSGSDGHDHECEMEEFDQEIAESNKELAEIQKEKEERINEDRKSASRSWINSFRSFREQGKAVDSDKAKEVLDDQHDDPSPKDDETLRDEFNPVSEDDEEIGSDEAEEVLDDQHNDPSPIDDETLLDKVKSDFQFEETRQRFNQRLEAICRKAEGMQRERDNLEALGIPALDEEIDDVDDDDEEMYEYIPCKRGTFRESGEPLTEEEIKATEAEQSSCGCPVCAVERETEEDSGDA